MNTPPTTTMDTSLLRPRSHFTSESSWLNDPNGLLFHEGVYHLFFQTNPNGSTWGNISWGHATSTDLVTWVEQEIAIPCTPDEMAFSGSAVVDTQNTAGFAGRGETALVAVYTSARPAQGDRPASQSQSIAFSLDDGSTWTRYAGNPVLDIGSDEFRDPKVFWYGGAEGHWVLVAVEAVARRVVIYTSTDLKTWTSASSFGPAHATGGVWECPDLFALPVAGSDDIRWVLVVSMNPGGIAGGSGTQYFVGDFDGWSFTAERLIESDDPADFDWLDYGRDYYAAVSFNGVPDGRRLMIGWASNWDYANETPTHPWRSAMSLVREVSLVACEDGRTRIVQRPILPADRSDLLVFEGTVPVGSDDISRLVVASSGDDRLVVTVDGADRTITCDRTQSGATSFHADFASIDRAPLPVGTGSTVDILIVVDAMIVEIYLGGGLVTFTEQVFPADPLTTLSVESSQSESGQHPASSENARLPLS